MNSPQVGSSNVQFTTEIGPCAILLEVGEGCLIVENGEPGTPIDETTLRAHLEGPGGSEDVLALIEDRTGAIADPDARKRVLEALDDWKRQHYE